MFGASAYPYGKAEEREVKYVSRKDSSWEIVFEWTLREIRICVERVRSGWHEQTCGDRSG